MMANRSQIGVAYDGNPAGFLRILGIEIADDLIDMVQGNGVSLRKTANNGSYVLSRIK